MKIDLFGGTDEEFSPIISNQLSQNWYPHPIKGGSAIAMYPTPGKVLWTSLLTDASGIASPVRNMIVNRGTFGGFGSPTINDQWLWVVAGDTAFMLDIAGNTQWSDSGLETSTGEVNMIPAIQGGYDKILLLDGTNYTAGPGGYYIDTYIISTASVLSTFTDADFPATALRGSFLDGYAVVNDGSNLRNFQLSDIDDITNWDPLNVALKRTATGVLRQIERVGSYLVLFGEKTTEFWQNVFNTDFALQRIDTKTVNFGIDAPQSAARMDKSVIWLAASEESKLKIVQSSGNTIQVLSTPGIEETLSKMSTTNDAKGWFMFFKSHPWYLITFPQEQKTLVYDFITKSWFEFKSYGREGYNIGSYANYYGKHLISDEDNNNIYEWDDNTYTDNGDIIKRIRRTQFVNVDDKKLRYKYLELEFEAGVGNSDEADPVIMIRMSDVENDYNWSDTIYWPIGALGKRSTKVRIPGRLLGSSTNRQFEISISDPVKAVMKKATTNVVFDP